MTELSAEQRALLSLTLVSGLGPRLTAALLQHFGSAQATVGAAPAQLVNVHHIGNKLARQFRSELDQLDVDAELARLDQKKVRLVFQDSADYPRMLKTTSAPPVLLYVRGTLEMRDRQAIALVGSRQCSSYGRRIAEKLAQDLARAGWTIVSGLARGIDAAAHQGALKARGRTIAVLAGGLSSIYPPEHTELADHVAASGALLTEAHMQMEPLAVMFPDRNRIISGLARAVVIVEARKNSGALHTAKHAAEQGREVFAIPGPVDSASAAGSLELLRDGARLIRNADDLMEDLKGIAPLISESVPAATNTKAPAPERPEDEPIVQLDATEKRIWDLLEDQQRHQDAIVQELEIPVAQLSGILTMLEMKRVIRRLPGNRFERCR